MLRIFKHFKTITYHKWLVMKGCFKVGLYRQGIMHDLSKYSPAEFWIGVKYFQGTKSPNTAERDEKGYSSAWLHHKGRNKHHYEYWIDFDTKNGKDVLIPAPMPINYIAEMIMDRIAACKVYQGSNYKDASALEYYLKGCDGMPIHSDTKETLEFYLRMLAKDGEKRTFQYLKNTLKACKKLKKLQ